MSHRVGRLALVTAAVIIAAVTASASEFEVERSCMFRIPLVTGDAWVADEPPLRAFGNLLAKRDRRTTSIPLGRVSPIGPELQRSWDECASWRALDSGGLNGLQFPLWSALVPTGWSSPNETVFVYVFWGWCEPCMVSLRHVRDLGAASARRPRILIVAMDASNPAWPKALSKHGLTDGPSVQTRYLDEEPFMQLSRELKRGSLLGIAFITNGRGTILHSDVRPPIAVEVTKRVIASRSRQ